MVSKSKIFLSSRIAAGLLFLALCQPALLMGDTPGDILIDRAAPLSGLDQLDGLDDSGEVSLPRWRQAMFELRRSATRDLGWPSAREVQARALADVARQTIPLTVLHAAYERPDSDGTPIRHEVFAFTPLREVNYFPHNTHFSIPRQASISHGVAEIESLSFDAGDGLGFRTVQWGENVDVHYAQGGTYYLMLRATLADGSVRQSKSVLQVIRGPAPPPPSATWMVTAGEEYLGVAGTGQAYLYLAEGHAQLTNPVVIVEGFDIDNSIDWPVLYELLNRENLLEDLRGMGFDAVVLDFTEAVEPIQRNAFVLTRLIELVQAEIAPGQDIALVGASMGGLVSRYGLLWMEDQGLDHRVRNFLSFDAPHGGANIPLGLQHWVEFFSGESEDAAFFLSRLNSDAARQMLLYHLSSTLGTMAAPDPLLASLNADLVALGDWPQDTRLSSIINGSGSMAGQGFNAGDQIIDWSYSDILVDIEGNAWAVPGAGSQEIFEGLIDIIFVPPNAESITVENTLPWDNSPGGYRATMDQLADTTAPYGDIVALHGSHSFIPSVSGLAIGTVNPFYDIVGDASLPENIPFDQAYFPVANQEHIEITVENKAWFISEITFGLPEVLNFSDGFEARTP